MHFVNIILFWVFFGFWSSYLAKKKERNSRLWFCLGILLGVIGVIVIALLPKLKRRENVQPILETPFVEVLPKIWFFLDVERKPQGPFTSKELKENGLKDSTYIWKEGMEGWKPFKEISELRSNL